MAQFSSAILYDVIASQPTDNNSLTIGRLFYASDTSTWYRDNGSSWDELPSSGVAGALSGLTDAQITSAAKGDLLVWNNADSKWENLAVGADGKVLVAASGEALGVKWDDPPASNPNSITVFYGDNQTFPANQDPAITPVYNSKSGSISGDFDITSDDSILAYTGAGGNFLISLRLSIQYSGTADVVYIIEVYKNGSQFGSFLVQTPYPTQSASFQRRSIFDLASYPVSLATSDYLEVKITSLDVGGSLRNQSSAERSYITLLQVT